VSQKKTRTPYSKLCQMLIDFHHSFIHSFFLSFFHQTPSCFLSPAWTSAKYRKSQRSRVIINDKSTAEDHVSSGLASHSRSLYTRRRCEFSGTTDCSASSLQDVFRATVIAKLVYYALAWSELCSANDRARLDTFLRRSERYGYCADDVLTIIDLFAAADQSLDE